MTRSEPVNFRRRSSLTFRLSGYWSESSGKVCMVGSGYSDYKDESLDIPALFKLHNLKNSTMLTSLNDIPPGLSFSSLPRALCLLVFSQTYDLKYSSQNFIPLGMSHGYSPRVLRLDRIKCLGSQRKLRLLMKFPNSNSDMWNYRTLDPEMTLVGEGTWDEKNNHLNVVACWFLDATAAHVGDCSTRLILRFEISYYLDHWQDW
ncbi:hypothetical protein PanWU01x14_300310 [Parasponia andersonii]|uniref:DUF2921 domain-containing protein n=1 Tax=Parasponia andersonii TaxID=3476 RepID=A0A2P5AUC1_PARAD|nr:hypothetical protein PanWU01x14_300310 [Parasponia andersonii]